MAAKRKGTFGSHPPSMTSRPTVDIDELASAIPGSRMIYNQLQSPAERLHQGWLSAGC